MHPDRLPDVQSTRDLRGIPLQEVGVRDLKYPIRVLDRRRGYQDTVATISMAVSLPHHFKGTHMSRFVEILNHYHDEFTLHTLPAILEELRRRLHAESARIEITFPYFLERSAPVTGLTALMDYTCTFTGFSFNGQDDFILGVRVPVTSLCPCSKEISDYGAHNQRGEVFVQVRSVRDDQGKPAFIWIEELIDIAESSASAPVYPLLKRQDERYVTMRAYDKPAFVEDIARDVALKLMEDPRVAWFEVMVTNFESIHNHNAYARTSWQRS